MDLKDKIHTIRNKQVILDRDLAGLYGVETKALNQAVKRNKDRFPKNYMFQLNGRELEDCRESKINSEQDWKSQNVTSNDGVNFKKENLKSQNVTSSWGGIRKKPYAFTEQGVSMLSAVLKSKTAIEISIKIIDAFVEMRHFIQNNANIFQKFQQIDQKFLVYDEHFNEIFKAIESKQLTPSHGIFFDGQIYDAYKFIKDLVNSAKESITLIDNYVNEDTLMILCNENVKIRVYTRKISKELSFAKNKFNQQYGNLEVVEFDKSHDRFLIIDDVVYHIGASLKDVGKKWFAFSKMNMKFENILF